MVFVPPQLPSPSTWTSYTPVIGATTTAPTLGADTTLRASYAVFGKMLHIRLFIARGTLSGTNGSGVYRIPLPAGFTIDTTGLQLNPTTSTTQSNRAGTIVGRAEFRVPQGTGNFRDGLVSPATSTSLMVRLQDTAFPWSSDTNGPYFLGATGSPSMSLYAVVPIL